MDQNMQSAQPMPVQQMPPTQPMPGQPSQPAMGGKKALWVKVLVGFVVAIFAIVIFAFVAAYAMTAKPTAVAKEFVANISAGNIGKAYNLTSNEFRAATSQAQLEAFVKQYPILNGAPEPSFNDRSVENGQATISGTITGKDGSSRPINVYLTKVEDEWLVLSLDLEPKKAE